MKGRRYGHKLRLVESNYSGTGADIAECTSCGRTFQITYKVDQILPTPQFETERNG
jgi:hypothetical protein